MFRAGISTFTRSHVTSFPSARGSLVRPRAASDTPHASGDVLTMLPRVLLGRVHGFVGGRAGWWVGALSRVDYRVVHSTNLGGGGLEEGGGCDRTRQTRTFRVAFTFGMRATSSTIGRVK